MRSKAKAIIITLQVLLFTGPLFPTVLSAQTQSVNATIDASKTGTPISKYIYGQFLEHIGGIVNNNIWAEMLDDRKFYYPITSHPPAEPPGPAWRRTVLRHWTPIGGDEFVIMDADHAYVGDHTPMVKLSPNELHGIQQAGLAVRKGKSYTGRVILAGTPGTTVKVNLIWGDAASDRQTVVIGKLGPDYRKFPLSFQTQGDSDDARLEIVGTGTGTFHVGAVSLMPSNNVQGFRAEVIAALKQLHSGVYRWPGGNFVSGHEWRDAIGDPDKRPPIMDPVWHAVQPNDVGTDEFMTLCRLLDVEAVHHGQWRIWRRLVCRATGRIRQWRSHHTDGEDCVLRMVIREPYHSQVLGCWQRALGRVATRLHARCAMGTETQHVRQGHAKGGSNDQADRRRSNAGRHDRFQAGKAPERSDRAGLPLARRLERQFACSLSRQHGSAQRALLLQQRSANGS